MNAPRSKAGDLLDVVTRCVHENEATTGWALPVVDYLGERSGSALLQGTQALLLDRCQSAGLVAGCWLGAPRVRARGDRVPLPGGDRSYESVRDASLGRALGEQVFGADESRASRQARR